MVPLLLRMVADKVAALTTSQAITAALFARDKTGEKATCSGFNA